MREVMGYRELEPDTADEESNAITASNHGCVLALTDPMKDQIHNYIVSPRCTAPVNIENYTTTRQPAFATVVARAPV